MIARLRRAAAIMQQSADPDLLWLAAALARYEREAPSGLTIDDAVGLSLKPGETPWWKAEAIQQRNERLRALKNRYFRDMGIKAASQTIIDRADQLRTYGKPTEDQADPAIDEILVEIIQSGVTLPSKSAIRNILAL